MALQEIQKNLLVHELQLGEKLSECVHDERRYDFSLMLAMLADDVRTHSQFIVPKTELTDKTHSDASLRKAFSLADKAPLSITKLDEIELYNQAQLIASDRLIDLKLKDALKPKPLAFRNDKNHIPTDILSNTSLLCQKNINSKVTKSATRLNFNAMGWLSALQTSIVKSPLLAV